MTGPDITPGMRTIMDETMAMLKQGQMVPPAMEIPWERRREGELTPNYLGRVLDEAGLPDLARRAREGHFDDYQAPDEAADGLEIIRLASLLREAAAQTTDPAGNPYTSTTQAIRRGRVVIIENALRRGEFDATKAESDRWAASADGQRTFAHLVGSPRPGRNEPCPCGSGRKFKRCHGA
jgi:hypothetical protein